MAEVLRISLIGTGALGASLAHAWKAQQQLDVHVTGLDTPGVLNAAAERGAVDAKAASLPAAVAEAALVVLAAPLAASVRMVKEMVPHLQPGTTVTDVGTVKTPIAEAAREALGTDHTFVGGHPLVTLGGAGIDAARADALQGASYVLCPSSATSEADLRSDVPALWQLIEAIGARPVVTSAARHDRLMALTRQMPRLLAATLNRLQNASDAESAFLDGSPLQALLGEAAPFPPPEEWAANQGAVLDQLAELASALQKTRNRLAADDFDALAELAGSTSSETNTAS